jgi:hypothetical protein
MHQTARLFQHSHQSGTAATACTATAATRSATAAAVSVVAYTTLLHFDDKANLIVCTANLTVATMTTPWLLLAVLLWLLLLLL